MGASSIVGLDMAKGMGVMFAAQGVMSAITDSFKQVVEYDNTMKSVRAILSTTDTRSNFDGRFEQMEETVRRVGRETKFTAPEVAGAAKFMAMAGLNIDNINAATKPIANVALVGDTTLDETADKMTNIMTSFGLLKGLTVDQQEENMNHTADILTSTFTRSNTSMMQLAEAMQYAGPMAHLFDTKLEDAAAMIGIMGNSGIQASMAGTSLRMMYQNIVKPSKAQAKEWEKLGVARTDDNGRIRPIFDILKDLRAKLLGTDNLNVKVGADNLKDLGKGVMEMFRVTAGSGVAALLENLGEAEALAKANRTSDGVAAQIAEEKKNTISGLWAQVTSTFTDQNLSIATEFQQTIKTMLMDMRDWLSSTDAANALRTVYDLIKSLLDTFKTVARMWLGIYSSMPWLWKFFIKFQLGLKQISLLTSPFVGMVRALQSAGAMVGSFVTTLNTLGGATTVATTGVKAMIASNTVAEVFDVGAAVADNPVAAQAAERKARIYAATSKRHALRKTHGPSMAVIGRGISMNKWNAATATKMSFSAGRAALEWANIAVLLKSIGTTLKSGLMTVVMGLSRGLGMLCTPVGAAIAAVGALAAGVVWLSEKISDAREEAIEKSKGINAYADRIEKEKAKNFHPLGVIDSNYKFSLSSGTKKTPSRSHQLRHDKERKYFFQNDNLGFFDKYYAWGSKEAQDGYDALLKRVSADAYGKTLSWNEAKIREAELQKNPRLKHPETSKQRYELFNMVRNRILSSSVALNSSTHRNAITEENKIVAAYIANAANKKIGQDKARADAVTASDKLIQKLREQQKQARSFVGADMSTWQSDEISKEGFDQIIENVSKIRNYITGCSGALADVARKMNFLVKDAQGRTAAISLPFKDDRLDWESLKKTYEQLGVKFTNGVQMQLTTMIQLFRIAKSNKDLAKRFANQTAGQFADNISQVRVGDKIAVKEWRNVALQFYDAHPNSWIRKKYKTGEEYYKSMVWTKKNLFSQLRGWALGQQDSSTIDPNAFNTPTANTNSTTGGTSATDQKNYDSKYSRSMARPTQIVFNIDNLCNFNNTQVNSTSQQDIAQSVGRQLSIGLQEIFAQAVSNYAIIGESA